MVRCGIHFHTVGLENNFAWRVDEGHFLNLFSKMLCALSTLEYL